MNKQKAIELMLEGAKLTHTGFTPREWMTMTRHNRIVFEDGCRCTTWEFWRSRTDDSWNEGWSIWKCPDV